MSKMTDANQANMYCGFYPSNNGDRKYGSSDFGKFLNGLVCDGVFLTLYNQFKVSPTPNPGRSVVVNTGKAWFNNTWLELVEEYPIECEAAYQDGDRYDAIVIALNTTNVNFTYDGQLLPARDTTIIAIKGAKSTAGNQIVPITAGNQEVSEGVYLYPLADIYRGRATTAITSGDIRIRVGEAVCPYVEAIVTPSNNATEFTEMWRVQLDTFIDGLQSDWDAQKEVYNNDWNAYFNAKQIQIDALTEGMEASIQAWFNDIKSNLAEETAVNLQYQIDAHEVENVLLCGLPDGEKNVHDDGTVIESTDSRGWTLVTTFSIDFSSMTTILYDEFGIELGRRHTYISSDGKAINSTLVNNAEVHSTVRDFSSLFAYNSNITTIPYIDTSGGYVFYQMFRSCSALTSIPKLDVRNGVDFSMMFFLCSSLVTAPLLYTINGTNFNCMYLACDNLKTVPWIDVSKSTNCNDMFGACTKLEYITFHGIINTSISFADCPNLDVVSAKGIVEALSVQPDPSLGNTITFSSTTWNSLQAAFGSQVPEGYSTWKDYISNYKGWNYA